MIAIVYVFYALQSVLLATRCRTPVLSLVLVLETDDRQLSVLFILCVHITILSCTVNFQDNVYNNNTYFKLYHIYAKYAYT